MCSAVTEEIRGSRLYRNLSSIHDTYTHLSHTKHFAKKKRQTVRVLLCNIIINSSSEIKI